MIIDTNIVSCIFKNIYFEIDGISMAEDKTKKVNFLHPCIIPKEVVYFPPFESGLAL